MPEDPATLTPAERDRILANWVTNPNVAAINRATQLGYHRIRAFITSEGLRGGRV